MRSRFILALVALGWLLPGARADWLGVWHAPLPTARAARELPTEQLPKRHPVKLTGVVTHERCPGGGFILQERDIHFGAASNANGAPLITRPFFDILAFCRNPAVGRGQVAEQASKFLAALSMLVW